MESTGTGLQYERTVAAPIDTAFDVFTKRVDEWWPRAYRLSAEERTGIEIEPGSGGTWYETTAGGPCPWGLVLDWSRPNRLSLGWQITPAFSPEPDPARASRIVVEFVADGPDRTRVRLVHDEFDRHGDGWEQMRAGVEGEGGWPGILDAYVAVADSA